MGEPLYLDVFKACEPMDSAPIVVGGRYGLGSKDTRPAQIAAVYRNLRQEQPLNGFTLGIIDDVTHTSLVEGGGNRYHPPRRDYQLQVLGPWFGWNCGGESGCGADYRGEHTDLFAQAYFSYDSKKSGGVPQFPTCVLGPNRSKPPIWWIRRTTLPVTILPLSTTMTYWRGSKRGGRIRTELPMEIR